jgi:hypothetical protein
VGQEEGTEAGVHDAKARGQASERPMAKRRRARVGGPLIGRAAGGGGGGNQAKGNQCDRCPAA